MKKIFFLAAFIILSSATTAQMPQNWDAFGQKIDVTSYNGKKFRLQAAVKVQPADSKAGGEIWARIDKKDKTMGFFYNMMYKPVRENNWHVYTIEGRIDKGAQWLNIGGLYQDNGIFSFDDFTVSIENKNNEWINIPVVDSSFEEDADSANAKWFFFYNRKGFIKNIINNNSYQGDKHLQITGSNIAPAFQYGDNDTAGKYADVNGIKIYYETYGDGPPLLLLHGNRSPIGSFYKQIPEFAKYFKVIAVDTRGQGKSNENGKRYSYDLFAEDMDDLLDYLHLDSVNIVGWSDGGNTGLIMAMKYPAKVKRLVTMGANVFIDASVVDKKIFKEIKNQLKEVKDDTSYRARNDWRLANLLLTEPQHTFTELNIIKCPVMVIAGENDVIKEDHTKAIAANIPGSTLMIVPKATHYLPQENAALFNKLVIDFLLKH